VRVKLFSELPKSTYDASLGLDRNGFLDVSHCNGFFFVGFLEFFSGHEERLAWPITKDPGLYNNSLPCPNVPDLNWWLAFVSMELQRERDKRTETTTKASRLEPKGSRYCRPLSEAWDVLMA
jgi:hypothetical protein